MSSCFYFELHGALCALIAALTLQIEILNPRDKIIQNVKFSPVSQNIDLSEKLDSSHQNEFRGMFSFQNKASKAYKPKITREKV